MHTCPVIILWFKYLCVGVCVHARCVCVCVCVNVRLCVYSPTFTARSGSPPIIRLRRPERID